MSSNKERHAKLVGERVMLCPIRIEDVHLFHKWINDIELTKYLMILPAVLTIEDEKEWFESSRKSQDSFTLSIVLKDNQRTIGNLGLKQINKNDGSGDFGIMIGEKEYWNKGYGTEATKLILDFAFNVLRLHSIHLKVYNYNKRALRSYEKIGFKKCGYLRESKFYGGKYHDIILMDILETEFNESYIKNLVNSEE
ncbi:MAG: N-acetyltransferase [Promethearchaeota archaeon]|nr:MAG: N-acetyltransferase [Candidatus Lokiarchaeota archaeon]